MEWVKKYRPKMFKEIVGQDGAVKVLQSYLKSNTMPHSILMAGSTGCGKTTLARILKSKLECGDLCYEEVNIADDRGIGKIREISEKVYQAPVGGKSRIWVLDELHRATKASFSMLLKVTEDTPKHIYFIACTTDPEVIPKPLRDRFTRIDIKPVDSKNLQEQMAKILEKEKLEPPPEDVITKIVEVAEGSVRSAVSILERVMQRKTPEEMLEEVESHSVKEQAIMIARLLARVKPKATWQEIAKVLKDVDEEPESLRYMILGYATSILMNNSAGPIAARAYLIIEAFEEHFYNSKRAGLVKACYDVIHG